MIDDEDVPGILQVAELLLPATEEQLRELVADRLGSPYPEASPLELITILQGVRLPWHTRSQVRGHAYWIAELNGRRFASVFKSDTKDCWRLSIRDEADRPDVWELYPSPRVAMVRAEDIAVREGLI